MDSLKRVRRQAERRPKNIYPTPPRERGEQLEHRIVKKDNKVYEYLYVDGKWYYHVWEAL